MPGQDPTILQIFAFLSDLLDYCEERDKHGNANAINCYGLYSTALTTSGGEYMKAALAVLDEDRASGASRILTPARLQSIFGPVITEALRKYDLDRSGSYTKRLFRLIEKLETAPETFNSREMTFGAPTFAGAAGNGKIRRVSVDRFSNDLECTGAEAKQAKCIKDQTNGARKHREVFLFESTTPARDALLWTGSGMSAELAAADCLSGGVLKNPSFESNGASSDNVAPSSTTAITNWVLTATTYIKLRNIADAVYRGYVGAPSTLWGLEFIGNGKITQTILSASPSAVLDENVPWYWQAAVKRKALATGNFKITVGSKTVTQAIGSLTNDAWSLVTGTLGVDSWYKNFGNAQSLKAELEVDTLATGTVYADDFVLQPMVNLDGTYYAVIGGDTPFLRDDKATWTDTEAATRGRISYWLWRSLLGDGGRYAPELLQALGGVWLPTVKDPTVPSIPD